jgi:tRNA (mo5U34)-methyltransferase
VGSIEAATLRRRVDELNWFHQIDLGHGIVTPGADPSAERLAALQLPPLAGKTVLDIGAWDGYFSFAAERLGAARVLATDSYVWGGASWGSMAGFELARVALDSRVEDRYIDVMDLSPDEVGMFDVVLFLGVLYHLRHPLLALERVAAVVGELLVVETHVDLTFLRRPAAAFYPGGELAGDETNWWGPNANAVVAMLRAVGFTSIEIIGGRSAARALGHVAHNLAGVVRSRLSSRPSPLGLSHLATDRLVVHAHRASEPASPPTSSRTSR